MILPATLLRKPDRDSPTALYCVCRARNSVYPPPYTAISCRGRFGADTNPNRLKMAEFPHGASIIPNSYNRICGFSLREHHFVPGFPIMAWPMVEWVFNQR